jgi:hypothetical protein
VPGVVPAAARAKPVTATATRRAAVPRGQRRRSAGRPATAAASRATVTIGTAAEDRLPGTVWAFQMPPVPARAPSGPLQFSARAAKAATPSGSERPSAPLATAATNHGAFSSATAATAGAHDRTRSRPAVRAAVVTRAISPPVGVSAATPAETTSRGSAPGCALRRPTAAATSHGSAA